MNVTINVTANATLNGKNALITGSSRGIGKAIALRLARDGATVIINYLPGMEDAARSTVAEIEAQGGKAISLMADVTNEEQVAAMFQQIATQCGTLDILVNNAGITRDQLIIRMKTEDFQSVLRVNLEGTFLCSREAAKIMIRQRSGRIISISSVNGVAGSPGQANYAASKAGIIGLTKSLAKELGSRGITVNAVAPGYIQTDMTAVLPDKVKESILGMIPLQQLGKPEDVANLVAFLASEDSRYITGQVIHVDGGMVM
ncbi:MAG: 3-oxoacyl-[acyl-carrier-protein] reductase [Bacillota bacterium]|jgi:3-oxoacyl-[acyl-carrier protein] reductase